MVVLSQHGRHMKIGSAVFVITKTYYYVGTLQNIDELGIVLKHVSTIMSTGDVGEFMKRGMADEAYTHNTWCSSFIPMSNVIAVHEWPNDIEEFTKEHT